MNSIDLEYQMIVDQIVRGGEDREGRNGKVRSSFYPFVLRCDKAPLVGWRKINHHLGIREMSAFVEGAETLDDLDPAIRPWWRPTTVAGHLGHDWYTDFYNNDLPMVISTLKNSPYSRRHLFSCWDTWPMAERSDGGYLPNCHSTVCQFYVDNHKTLHYKTYQRSADVMLGLPYNLIQHWALLEYVAYRTDSKVGTMSYILGDSHIYHNHMGAAKEMLRIRPVPENNLELIYTPTGDEFKASDFKIIGECNFPIKEKLEMSV